MVTICLPASVYLIFSFTQIIIDTIKGLYNSALMKVIVTFMVTLLLNILCEKGYTSVSWMIVFIPFILMTVIVSILLYVFGIDTATGGLNYKTNHNNSSLNNGITTDNLGNIIIYDPQYNPNISPVYYKSPNIIIPNPHNNNNQQINLITPIATNGSSSPAYIS